MYEISWSHRKIDSHKSIIDVVVFNGTSNVQLCGELLKIHYPNISAMRRVEHTVSSFFKLCFQNLSYESNYYSS